MTKKITKDGKPLKPPLVKPPTEEIDFNKDFAKRRTLQADNIGGLLPVPVKKATPVKAKQVKGKKFKNSDITTDSFANFTARLGIQANNLSSTGYYHLGPYITRNRLELEAAYRDNWLVGKAVDCRAEDMTRDGLTMYSEMKPKDVQKLQVKISEFNIWHDLCNTIKWGKLYGGALAVILIDGHKYDKPLNIEAVGKDKFKGLVVLDRWMVQPSMGELIKTIGKDMGKPEYYEVLPGVSVFPTMKIHHTRVLRFEGIELPYYQKLFENLWGLSIVERILDRLMAFDSATLGAAQLMYKAYLRVIGIEGFRDALAMGGKTEEAVIRQFEYIRLMQTNEGLTVLDSKDEFHAHQYSFGGVSDVLQQFGQQISGAIDIPLVRLFGQSPTGFNTGDSDLRNYYDGILKEQENQLRPNMDKLLAVMSMSVLGEALPEDFEYKFNPLWQMSEKEKAEIAQLDSATVSGAVQGGLITKKTGLKELLQSSRVTGRFTNITDEDIEEAEEEPPSAPDIIEGEVLPNKKEDVVEEKENPNESLGGANPELTGEESKMEKETGDAKKKIIFKDVLDIWEIGKSKVRQMLDDFKETEHPRGKGEKGGQFVSKGEGGGGTSGGGTEKSEKKREPAPKVEKGQMLQSVMFKGKRLGSDGGELPKHVAKTKIPLVWTDVIYSANPDADLIVKGKDVKGRVQYIYSEKHWDKQSKAKYSRIEELNKKFKGIMIENGKNMKGDKAEEATVLSLIMQTGIRPGSDVDLKADQKAYGATTLEGKHVKINKDGTVTLNFIGKKGVESKITVEDKNLAKLIADRAKNAGKNGKIFNCDNIELLHYSAKLDGGKFKTKDFRTLIGTKKAMEEIKKVDNPPTNKKEYKKAVLAVARAVAEKLGNTPNICLKAYISPIVFAQWRIE